MSIKIMYNKHKYMCPLDRKDGNMVLKNKLNIEDNIELSKLEEKISKKKALELYDKKILENLEFGTFETLSFIHKYLFDDIYYFAGKIRDVNLAKGSFRFISMTYLGEAISNIDKLPQSNYDEIIEKYIEMNIAHPFRECNGRSMRIWLDLMLKRVIGKVVDWSTVDKNDYLLAMERSPIKDVEIKELLKKSLTDKINDRDVYMKSIDHSYFYEGYKEYKTEEL